MTIKNWQVSRMDPYFANCSWRKELIIAGLGIAGAAIGLCIIKKIRNGRKMNVVKWERHKVYLCCFPRMSKGLIQVSPFALKLEAWLRLNEIPYEYVVTTKVSAKGQYPYVEINGEQIADSNMIIEELSKKFDVRIDKLLSPEQMAIARAFSYLMESHFCGTYAYYRYIVRNADMYPLMTSLLSSFSFTGMIHSKVPGMRHLLSFMVRKRLYAIGIARHSTNEINSIGVHDIQAVSDYLGRKQFMMGEKPTTVDTYIFGHMAQVLYLPLENSPQKTYILEKCPLLATYVNRMKNLVFPDWEKLLAAAAEGKMLTKG